MKTSALLRTLAAFACFLLCAPGVFAQGAAGLSQIRNQMDQGQYKQALGGLNHYLAQKGHAGDARARFLKGLALANLGQTKQAEQVFKALTREYPKLPEPYNNLAVLYARQGDYSAAEKELKAAIATHPSYATAQENLGDIYAARASQAYDKALSLDKGNHQLKIKLSLLDRLNSMAQQQAALAQQQAGAAQQQASAVASAKAASKSAATAHHPPATATASSAGKQPVSPSEKRGVRQAVMQWAHAWENEDLNAYLNAYAADFQPSDHMTHAQWKAQRRERVNHPKHIHITLSNMKISLLDSHTAEATFTQSYRSGFYSDKVVKMLVMRNSGSGWKIQRETVLRKLS